MTKLVKPTKWQMKLEFEVRNQPEYKLSEWKEVVRKYPNSELIKQKMKELNFLPKDVYKPANFNAGQMARIIQGSKTDVRILKKVAKILGITYKEVLR